MRSAFFWLLLAIGGLASPQEAKPITLDCAGARVGEAIRKLGEATQVDLRVHASFENEVIAFRFKNASIAEAMTRIATAVSGRWEQSGTIFTLAADGSVRSRQVAERRKNALERLRKQIADELSPPKETPDKNGDIHYGGGDLAVTRIVATLDLPMIVDLPEGGRVVYSTIPNRMQKSMRLAPSIIKELVDAHNTEAAEQKRADGGVIDAEAQRMREMMERYGMGRPRMPIKEEPFKAVMVIEKGGGMMGDAGNIQATLRLYSNQGSVLLSRNGNFYLSSPGWGTTPDVPTEDDLEKPPPPPKPEPQSPKIEWSPVAKELQARMNQGPFAGSAAPQKPWTDAAKQLIGNPDQVEPLKYLIGDGLLQVAAWKDVNFVANLPDQVAESMSGGSFASTCVAMLRWAETSDDLDSKMENGWWMLVPKDPIKSRDSRFSRVALATIAKRGMAEGRISLDDLAAYAVKSKPFMSAPLSAMLMFIVDPSILRLAFTPDAWEFLQLYGTLSAQEKVAVDGGHRVSFSGLTPTQSAIVNKIVFGAEPAYHVGPDLVEMDALGSFGAMMTVGFGNQGGQDNDYREEPTELLPDGLPSSGYLLVQIKDDVAMKAATSGAENWLAMFGSLGVEDLALYKFMEEKMGATGVEGFQKVERVTIGKRKSILMELHLAAGVKASNRFADDTFDKDSKPQSVDALPEALRTRIEKALEKIKKLNLPFFDPGMFGRPPGPPPAR